MNLLNQEYKDWFIEIKTKIKSAQIKAALSVNNQMITLYWDLGKMIVAKQEQSPWGKGLLEQVAKDLKRELPDTNGFSRTNLYNIRQFYLFYKDFANVHQVGGQNTDDINVHQLGGHLEFPEIFGKIPWRHHVLIANKIKIHNEALFYIYKTVENNWSRNILEMQIDSQLYNRQGKAISNFKTTLSQPQGDLAHQTLKDPYIFDFLTLQENIQELDLERSLVENITQFLLELGKGFAYIGRQYPIKIGNKERKLDLLFYHTRLHCYVVIDLKTGDFEPEYVGKMNYYLSAIDDQLKTVEDQPSIGIILCKQKDNIEVEFALRDINKPLGISEFNFNELPQNIQKNMPTIAEIEQDLNQ